MSRRLEQGRTVASGRASGASGAKQVLTVPPPLVRRLPHPTGVRPYALLTPCTHCGGEVTSNDGFEEISWSWDREKDDYVRRWAPLCSAGGRVAAVAERTRKR